VAPNFTSRFKRAFTADDIVFIKRGIESGWTTRRIADELPGEWRRSKSAIVGKIFRMKYGTRKDQRHKPKREREKTTIGSWITPLNVRDN
jgi:hypothetical protein